MEIKRSGALYQLRWVTRVLAVVILLLVVIGMLLPSRYHIERSIFINVPVDRASLYLGDLSAWHQWMYLPNEGEFLENDSASVVEGEPSLVIKNLDSKDGLLEIVSFGDNTVSFYVIPKADMLPVSNQLDWRAEGRGVRVSWQVDGELNAGFISPYIAFFANDIAGSNMENSLQSLKERLQ
ncbi:SRPBCC family protein [Marinomonas algicola]|jgi:hypothetical protein|uniref:SRPBCC family protein n=1 Tax=Marinomonas algicola TaxID=2773454 RepID=UPI001749A3A4|nr:SRPBCC family protein [Marinomonas algicola]